MKHLSSRIHNLHHIVCVVSQQQQHAYSAMERAKQVSNGELQAMMNGGLVRVLSLFLLFSLLLLLRLLPVCDLFRALPHVSNALLLLTTITFLRVYQSVG